MNIINKDEYLKGKSKNTDFYGKGIYDFAEKWADLMEQEFKQGRAIRDFADETSREADTDGITGFMYGCAVEILSKYWEHGEELRLWHNSHYGHTGDGVVNPAVLTINVSEKEVSNG
jgi:hypothetical protein